MTILKIAQVGHPVLRERARELSPEQLASPATQTFIDDLIETMRDANGAGLAAPQVHSSLRIAVIEVKNNPRYPYKPNIPLTVLVNPVITPLSTETFENYEGCLSVPNIRGVVDRHAEIEVAYLDRQGAPHRRKIVGLTAGTYQHEVDHLDGKVFLDRVKDTRTLTTWAEFDRYHKQAFVDRIIPFIAKWGS